MLVAGVDVGNSTTEVAVARVEPGSEPEWLLVLRRPTTGPKGSRACAEGVSDLIGQAERRLGERPHLLLLAELHPVESSLVELGMLEELDLARTAIARPASSTPSGEGVAVGVLRPLAGLTGEPDRRAVLVVVAGWDFDHAAERLREARDRGWTIAGAIVQEDDAVLIGNRFDRGIPIVDEVADAAGLPLGSLAAVEVAAPGESVLELADPLRLAVLLGLSPTEARAARHAARAVAGHRAAIVCRGEPGGEPARWRTCSSPSRSSPPTVAPSRSTSARRFRPPAPFGHCEERQETATACATSSTWRYPRRRTTRGSHDALRDGEPLPSLCSPTENRAACSPSSRPSLPAAPESWRASPRPRCWGRRPLREQGTPRSFSTSAAARSTCTGSWARRSRSSRLPAQGISSPASARRCSAATPRLPSGRNGCGQRVSRRRSRCTTRTVAAASWASPPRRAPSRGSASSTGGRLLPLEAQLAPEVWRGLRAAAKRDVIARNVRRAIDAAGEVPRGELVTLVGGSACDAEVVEAVAAELADLDVAVARGDVLGRHGPRAAVAVGLVLAHARGGP